VAYGARSPVVPQLVASLVRSTPHAARSTPHDSVIAAPIPRPHNLWDDWFRARTFGAPRNDSDYNSKSQCSLTTGRPQLSCCSERISLNPAC
jgi:hypothetical protein